MIAHQKLGQSLRWLAFVFAAVGAMMVIFDLITGCAISFFYIGRPTIVRRRLSPGRYWLSVVFDLIFTAVALWVALVGDLW